MLLRRLWELLGLDGDTALFSRADANCLISTYEGFLYQCIHDGIAIFFGVGPLFGEKGYVTVDDYLGYGGYTVWLNCAQATEGGKLCSMNEF